MSLGVYYNAGWVTDRFWDQSEKNTGSANLSLRIIDTILSVRQYQHCYVT